MLKRTVSKLFETVLLSTHNIFGEKNEENRFPIALLSGGLPGGIVNHYYYMGLNIDRSLLLRPSLGFGEQSHLFQGNRGTNAIFSEEQAVKFVELGNTKFCVQ